MVSFDHRDPGTAEVEWAADDRWNLAADLDFDSIDHVVVLAAHPDDETLGAGGLMSLLHGARRRVTLVLATCGDPSLVRLREFNFAAKALCPRSRIVELGLPDGELREHRDTFTDSLADYSSNADLIVAPWRGDGHRDHRIAGEVAAEVADDLGIALIEYPIWLWHWASPDDIDVPWPNFATVPLDDAHRLAKLRALRSYSSQLEGAEPMLHSRMLEHFVRPWETFVV